jgi:prepilin-type N-terminal cleavage/methylation domain-containing protein
MRANMIRAGASLLELLIALFIIGLMLGIFLPAAWMVYQAALKIGQ